MTQGLRGRYAFTPALVGLVSAILLGLSAARAQTAPVPGDLLITLERTPCFGPCPVYAVTLDAGGNVAYDGRQFVRVEGRQTASIPPSRVAELLATAERIGFFELRDQYRTMRNPNGTVTTVSDLPTTFVTITSNGRSKRVEDYVGAPAGLRELEQQIDEAAGTRRWTRGS